MRKEFVPFYLSRAALSALMAILVMGLTWKAAILAVFLFGLFLLYSYTAEYLVACCQDECGQMRMAEIEKDIR